MTQEELKSTAREYLTANAEIFDGLGKIAATIAFITGKACEYVDLEHQDRTGAPLLHSAEDRRAVLAVVLDVFAELAQKDTDLQTSSYS